MKAFYDYSRKKPSEIENSSGKSRTWRRGGQERQGKEGGDDPPGDVHGALRNELKS
jgi:hypothetical protein